MRNALERYVIEVKCIAKAEYGSGAPITGRRAHRPSHDVEAAPRSGLLPHLARGDAGDGRNHNARPDQRVLADHVGCSDVIARDQRQQ